MHTHGRHKMIIKFNVFSNCCLFANDKKKKKYQKYRHLRICTICLKEIHKFTFTLIPYGYKYIPPLLD